MKRRISLRFLEAYILIGLVGFLLITLAGSRMVESVLEEDISSGLYQDAHNVAENQAVKSNLSSSNLSRIQSNLYMLSQYPSVIVWIINNEGEIIVSTRTDIAADEPIRIEDFDPSDWGSSYYQIGNFYGFFPEEYLSVLAPITEDMTPKGYIALHFRMSDLYQKRGAILFIIQILFLAVYVLASVLLLIYWHYVHNPLREITRGVGECANGNLANKIPASSEDEIGYLANSLNYMAEKLNRNGEYQRQFISNISHDFRSPLTSIKGYVDAMLDGVIPADSQEKYLKIIAYEAGRLEKLTEGLLTLNELDIHKRLLKIETFDINEVIKHTAAAFEGDCTKRKIVLELVLSGRELYARADMEQIQQVLYNLLNNAVKFSRNDSTIIIETTEKNDKIFVSVKDHGIGIPKQSLHRIWERFYKTDISRGKDQTGTGLGLSIVKEIINAHGQNINVISTEGVGTEFIFTLEKAE